MKRFLMFLLAFVLVVSFSGGVLGEVIFEDDFDYLWAPSGTSESYPCTTDIGTNCASVSNYPISSYPEEERTNENSWNSWSRDAEIIGLAIESEIGINNSGALRVTYPAGTGVGRHKVGIQKWLGADGYDEIYIRWYFKYKDSGDDRWVWGNAGTFSFIKLGRFYQGVDLNNLRPVYPGIGYWVNPNSYPNYIIPDLGNDNSVRPIRPGLYTTCVNDEYVGSAQKSIWHVAYGYGGGNDYAFIAPADGTTDHVCGPIYTQEEDSIKVGEFKNPQTWHSLEYRFKLRELATVGNTIPATYVSDWQVSVNGDYTSTFTNGVLVRCHNTSQFDGWNKPVVHKVSSSSYSAGITTVVFEIQSTNYPPHLDSNITTVQLVQEVSPGVLETWIDGVSAGNHTTPTLGTDLVNNNWGGGLNYFGFLDNIHNDVTHPITMYIDDVVISTSYIGPDYVIGNLTCQSLGYNCCDSCQTGTEQSLYDGDCSGQVCCGTCSFTCSPADTNTDGVVDIIELMNYISEWKAGSVTITELMTGIGEWKNGC